MISTLRDKIKLNYIELGNISKDCDLDPDFVESRGFAYLAARFMNNLPSSFPSTTGVKTDTMCGVLVRKNRD